MSLKISRVLHAGYIFESEEAKIIFDPIFESPFSNNCHAFPRVEFDLEQIRQINFDAIIISHYHDDHLSFESLNLLNRKTPIYIYCLNLTFIDLLKKLGFTSVKQISLKSKITIKDIEITPYPALDFDVDSIFHINCKNINILNVVDSWIDYDTLSELCKINWDLILWPFQTMREIEVLSPIKYPIAETELPPEWLDQLEKLNPRAIVPSSCQFNFEDWSWYRNFYFPITYKSFSEQIVNRMPAVSVVRLNPGESITYDFVGHISRTNRIEWINPIGDQNIDYNYDAHASIPDLVDFSKNFRLLEQDQKNKVLDFCVSEILKKFTYLDKNNAEYFNTKKIWKLIVSSSAGEIYEYCYEICGNNIKLILESTPQFDWLTEIPETKLYDAFNNCEALNSIYMRINNCDFNEEIQNKLASVDVFEDPLIRVLYENSFASYQRNQLKKILTNHD